MAQTWKDFVMLTKQMRDAQREYFRARSNESLEESKKLEAMVDDIVERGVRYYNSIDQLEAIAKALEKKGFERV